MSPPVLLNDSNFKSSNRIGVEMVNVIATSGVDYGFEPRSSQTKDYKICICCFSAEHAALRRKSKDWLDSESGYSESGYSESGYSESG